MHHFTVKVVFGALVTMGSLVPRPADAKGTAKTIGESEIAQAKAAAKSAN